MPDGLNDIVTNAGVPFGAVDYNSAKVAIVGDRTQDEVAVYNGADSYNAGLAELAGTINLLKDEATLWLDSEFSVSGEPRAINQGTGGTALDAKYGSVLGAYVYDGDLIGCGLTGNYVSVPDEAALDIAGDLEVFVHFNLPTKTVAAANYFIATRRESAAGNESFQFGFSATNLIVGQRVGGVSAYTTMTYAWLTEGVDYWLRWRRVAATGVWTVDYQVATDQVTVPTSGWLTGSTVTQAAGALDASSSKLYIGGSRGGTDVSALASIGRVVYNSSVGGSAVVDVNFSSCADYATSFTATTGQTVTVTSTTSDTNDPKLLTHAGDNYVYTTGGASSLNNLGITTPFSFHNADTKISALVYNQPTVTADSTLGGNDVATLVINSSGRITPYLYDSTTVRFPAASSSNAIPNGFSGWVEWRFNQLTGLGSYWTAPYSLTYPTSGWTAQGTHGLPAGYTAVAKTATGPYYVGRSSTSDTSIVRSMLTVGGSTVVDVNIATDVTSSGATSFTATTGQTVTVARATSGRKTALVTRPIWLFGTDDYMEVADNALLDFNATDDFTVLILARFFATPTSFGNVIQKATVADDGYVIQMRTTGVAKSILDVGATVVTADQAVVTLGSLSSLGMKVDRTAQTLTAFRNNSFTATASTAALGSMVNAVPLRVGASSVPANYQDMEVVAVAVFRRVLTTDEIAQINTYYGTA